MLRAQMMSRLPTALSSGCQSNEVYFWFDCCAVLILGSLQLLCRDGNAIMLSAYNRNVSILRNEFVYVGDNAIASWGLPTDTTAPPGISRVGR